MRIHYCTILSVCVLSSFANCVVAQQPQVALLTANEQAMRLGMPTIQDGARPLNTVTSSDYHATRVRGLLGKMDAIVPDGNRRGNPLFRTVLFHMEKAQLSGMSYDEVLNRVYRGQRIAPELIALRKQSLLTAIKAGHGLGLMTPENMERLAMGKAPVITKGNPKYLGQIAEVDHGVPIRGPNGRLIYENEPANMQMMPKTLNRSKWANIDEISSGREVKLDQAYRANARAYKANNIATAGGVLSTGGGIVMLYTSTRGLLDAASGDINDLRTKMQIGEQGSLFVAGGAFTVSGVAQIGSRFAATESSLTRLGTVSKMGGRVGIAGIILGESVGIGIDYYNWDEMTPRQRSVSLAQHSVSIGALALSFGVGCVIGIETGPGAIAFGLASAGATYAATTAAKSFVESSYDRLDDEQKKQVFDAIYRNYGVSP